MRRAGASQTQKDQDHNYRAAIRDFVYVQMHAPNDFALLPEVNLRKGFALLFLGEKLKAAQEFTEAIRRKPDYTPAYGPLIDYFVGFGKLKEAQELLVSGLKHAPSSELLRQKEEELKALQLPKTPTQ
jgi:hypothetical protein